MDWTACRARCAGLNAPEGQALVDSLALAIVLDGRTKRAQRELLCDACAACGATVQPDELARLRRSVMQGQGLG